MKVSFLIFIPIFSFYYLRANLTKLEKEDFKLKFESLYKNIITNNQIAYIYMPLFCIHRYIISFMEVFLNSFVQFNIFINILLELGVVILYLKYSPMKMKSMNNQEIMNASVILVTAYFIMMFTNFVPDPEIRYNLGFSIMYDLIIFFCVTFGYILYKMVYALYIARQKRIHTKAWNDHYLKKKKREEIEKKNLLKSITM